MLACSSFVACTNEETPEVNNGGEKSYVAVNIVMPGDVQSRAGEGDKYEAGTAAENEVTKAVFLFLDKNFQGCADPCVVNGSELKAWSNATGTGEDKQSNVVLVINGGDKQVPSYIVAVLNPNSDYSNTTSLADLKAEKATYKDLTDNGKFVMSNSVYVGDNGKEVAATPISIDNVKSDPDEAKKYPVTVYVERVVGKVEVTDLDDAADAWKTDETYADDTPMKLKLQITGWNVLQNQKSTTVKNISTAWDYDWWNAPNLHRSFWAIDAASEDRTAYKVEKLENESSVYVEETVNPTANDKDGNLNPYLLVSGKFVDADDETKAVELVEWRGQKYTKEGYLKFIAANPEVSQYYTYDETTKEYTSILYSALTMQDNEENDWQAQAVLSDDAKKTTYYTLTFKNDEEVDEATEVAVSKVEAAIEKFGEVQYWNGGNTYYYVPITHHVDGENTYYGVVRNHIYKVAINGIEGFGTPVADPNQAIDVPEKPEDDNSYLAAKVVILDWRVVNQDVTLK